MIAVLSKLKPAGVIIIAGDAGGILGAKAAEISGWIAALRSMGKQIPEELVRALDCWRRFSRFIDRIYLPVRTARWRQIRHLSVAANW